MGVVLTGQDVDIAYLSAVGLAVTEADFLSFLPFSTRERKLLDLRSQL